MSFSPNNTTKSAENNLGGLSNLAQNKLFPEVEAAGSGALKTGQQMTAAGAPNINAGADFFRTLLGGNAANTAATLQPSIDQIRQGVTNNTNAISTLTPRGGGRSSTLFSQAMQPQAQIQNLFNTGRTAAATQLPQIGFNQQQMGLGQQGIGTNLFNIGQGALGTAGGINTNLAQLGQSDRNTSNQLASALGGGLFKIATTPFGGGSAAGGLLGLLGR